MIRKIIKILKIVLLIEKEYIFECRAVVIKWDNGRKSVLVTESVITY